MPPVAPPGLRPHSATDAVDGTSAVVGTPGISPEHDGVEHVPVKKKGSRKR